MKSNVDFLVSQNYISQSDASAIVSRLPPVAGINQLTPQIQGISVEAPEAPVRRGIPAPPVRKLQARALWAYNMDGQQPEDLSFSAGDIIEIVTEINVDWWEGRVNGRQALFPSSYVEKIESDPEPQVPHQRMLPPQYDEKPDKPMYRPFGAALHGADLPPPSGSEVNSVGLQQAPGQEQKKDRFGKYKGTLAQSAVGGVGFGAGSAIGGGLVRAIF
jgi:hypothetical protein